MEIVGTLLRGVRGGWFQVERSAVIISQFGTLGSDLDEVIKKLLQDFKERISSGEASVFANVCIKSLKEVFIYLHIELHICMFVKII